MTMTRESYELVFLLLKYFEHWKFEEAIHTLEKESGIFFNMDYFEKIVLNGEWDEAESYLSGFTGISDNRHSVKTFFVIRRTKYLEAVDRKETREAIEVLIHGMKTIKEVSDELLKQMAEVLLLENIRDHKELTNFGGIESNRKNTFKELKNLIIDNPLFRDKLVFPVIKEHGLLKLINQSLNWQHFLCTNPSEVPRIDTLLVDHSCPQPSGAHAPCSVENASIDIVPKHEHYTEHSVNELLQSSHAPRPPPALASLAEISNCPGLLPSQRGLTSIVNNLSLQDNPTASYRGFPPTVNDVRIKEGTKDTLRIDEEEESERTSRTLPPLEIQKLEVEDAKSVADDGRNEHKLDR